MYTSRLDVPEHVRKQAIALLQARLADSIDLERQMKQAHWNAKGPDFFQLHQMFDAVHGVVEEFVDTIAERITALGGIADGRVQTAAATSSLYEYPIAAMSGEAHLRATAAALGQFGALVRKAVIESDAFGDVDTADVFTGISRESDKQLWFIEAHLMADK